MARQEEIANGVLRSIYFPAELRNYYLQIAKKQGTSFSRLVVETLEKAIPKKESALPDSNFGEYQLD